MRFFLGVCLILGLSSFVSNQFIDWRPNQKLSWKDFMGKPVANSGNAALTSTHISFEYGYGSNGFSYSITCRFDKKQSWVKIKNDYVLAHEQAHFDIAEIHARKLKKALSDYDYNPKTVKADVNKIYETIMKEHHAMQQLYDKQTDHSRNKDQQEIWLLKIADMLTGSLAYANYQEIVSGN